MNARSASISLSSRPRGLIFGLMENGSYTILATIKGVEPFALTRFFSFVTLLIILLLRPTGLFRSQ